jgi:hypothetical protein
MNLITEYTTTRYFLPALCVEYLNIKVISIYKIGKEISTLHYSAVIHPCSFNEMRINPRVGIVMLWGYRQVKYFDNPDQVTLSHVRSNLVDNAVTGIPFFTSQYKLKTYSQKLNSFPTNHLHDEPLLYMYYIWVSGQRKLLLIYATKVRRHLSISSYTTSNLAWNIGFKIGYLAFQRLVMNINFNISPKYYCL